MDSFTSKVFALLCVCISICYAATPPSTITINATIYDHSSLRNPDFENTIASDKGIVTSTLGGDRKPIYAHTGSTKTVHNTTTFNTWFRDTPGVNTPIAYPMKLTKSSSSNIYTFSDSTFFPIDGKGFGNEGRSHNYHFCLEIHSTFSYEGGETFAFTGDDDVFVYINNKLVIDLGGIHSAQSKSVSLDTLGLVKKTNYKFDLFFCERHTTQSNLKLQTSIQLYCQYTDRCGVCEGDGNTCPCTCNDDDQCTLDSCDLITGECVYSSSDQCSSAGDQSSWANTANLVGIVVGGTAFVGIATVGGKKAYDRYNGRKQPQPATTDTGLFYKWALRAKGGPQPAATV